MCLTDVDASSYLASLDRKIVGESVNSLHRYLEMVWPFVVPGQPFVDGRHIHELCDHLQAVSEGHIRNLLVNVPPGSTKSTIVCVVWPSWQWIAEPAHRWMFASYSDANVLRDARKAVELLCQPWHVERFGHILSGLKQSAKRVQTSAKGFRFATTVRGAGVGEHGKTRVVDDPIKPLDATGGARASKAKLNEVVTWYGGTWSSRSTDAAPRDVCIMQRVNQLDLAAHISSSRNDVVHLSLPMLFDPARKCVTKYHRTLPTGEVVPRTGGDWRTTKNELLCPARWTEADVETRRVNYGTEHNFQCQDQQNPTPIAGNMVKKKWLRYWHPDGALKFDPNGKPCLALPKNGMFQYQSWDLSFGDSEGSSLVSWGVFGAHGPFVYLLEQDSQRIDFVTSCDKMAEVSIRWPEASTKLVEDKANGTALENLMSNNISGIELYPTGTGSKPARLMSVLPEIRSGHLVIPHPDLQPETLEWTKEVCGFPSETNDDRVDVLSQAMRWRENSFLADFESAMADE